MTDVLLHAIINGNPLDLPSLGSNDNGMTILFPLSFGNTVNDLANALNLPVDSILAVNPGLQADSTLSVSQVVGLPDDRIEHIMQTVSTSYASTRAPASPSSAPMRPPSGVAPAGYAGWTSNDHANVLIPTLRALASELDLADHPKQAAVLVPPTDDDAQGWTGQGGYVLSIAGEQPGASVVAPLSKPVTNQTPANASPLAESTATPAMLGSGPGNVTVAASNQRQNPFGAVTNRVPATNDTTRVVQDRQRNPGSDIPPPPMDPRWFAVPFTGATSSGAYVAPPAIVTHAANVSGSPTALQLMALLMAQSGGFLAAGTSPVAPQSGQPLIDPQALAAYAFAMRAVKVVDLGAGRGMEYSLVRDRLQRIDPIGQEDRATSRRRTGDGLEEVRVSRPDQDDVEQTDEQREQGRRRRAAIAAMRRRRHARTQRCRYWRGSPSILRPSSTARYPKCVDWAEFRSRQPPRYM